MSDGFDLVIAFLLGAGALFFVIAFFMHPSNSAAELVCESHGMVLVSHEGWDEVVCEKFPDLVENPNRKVFRFE